MYIDRIEIKNFRTFKNSDIGFVHRDRDYSNWEIPKPKLPNINLLLGNNGFGKTSLLKAIALAALGPSVGDSGIFPYRLIRQGPKAGSSINKPPDKAVIEAQFTSHEQDQISISHLESHVTITRRGDLESLRWTHDDEKTWHPIFSSSSDALFFVGYGANRRVEKQERLDWSNRKQSSFARAQRIQSIFEETYSLVPLNAWLPQMEGENPGRFKQVKNLINRLLGPDHLEFRGELEKGEYLFHRQALDVPFPALSDGYRAFLGWVGDLLYHVCMTCPRGEKLVENKGFILIDEIDLHLHPKWQMAILPTLAEALPNIQFIVTSHSPLVVGSLEWMNIITMKPAEDQSTQTERIHQGVHGLDADQILLTEFFGLRSTRADAKSKLLKALTLKARQGDNEAAQELLTLMSRGQEES